MLTRIANVTSFVDAIGSRAYIYNKGVDAVFDWCKVRERMRGPCALCEVK